jgi:iron(III) transport system substrate-binding protein
MKLAAALGLVVSMVGCAPAAPSPTAAKPAAQATTAPAATAKPAVESSPTAAAAASPSVAAAKPAETKPAASSALDLDKLYEEAKKEGKVIYYSADEPEQLAKMREGFQKRYPGIEVQGQEGRGQDAREKVISEQAAKNVVGDIVVSGGNTMAELLGMGFLEPFQAPETAALLDGVADKRGYVNPRVVNVYGITVNTNTVKPADEPKSWKDLTDPKYKGELSAQDPRGSGGSLYIFQGLKERYGDSILADLAKQDVFFGTSNPSLVADLVRGEHSLLISTAASQVIPERRNGAPLKFIKPDEGVILIPIGMALVKGAPHPNAAKLFINWMLSEEGQKVVAEIGATPARKGIAAAEPEADLTGAKIFTMQYDGSSREETADLSKKLDTIFFKS